jgi:hypothetical protein
METSEKRLRGDAQRVDDSDEVQQLWQKNERLKRLVAELSLANMTLKNPIRAFRTKAVRADEAGASAGSD